MKDYFAETTVGEFANIETIIFSSAFLTSPNAERQAASGFSGSVAHAKPLALVVDDAPDVLEMLAILLKHEGYEVVTAASAVAALEAAQTEHFDVVVSDIGMPEMDGYDLAAALRAMPDYRAVPMVAVTGFALYDDRERAMQSGFNAHLTKPINPMSLIDLIAELREQG